MRNGFLRMWMWPARIAAVSALAALGLALAAPAQALVMYSYTGKNFDTIFDNDPPDGTYTTDMSVTGTFTLAAPLVSFSGSITPLSYSFNDGRQTLDDGNSSISNFFLSTDAAGSPLEWLIEAFVPSFAPVAVGDVSTNIHTFNAPPIQIVDSGQIIVCIEVSDDGFCLTSSGDAGFRLDSPGSWTVTSVSDAVAVAEPSSLALMLAGLGLLGAFARRRPAARRF